MKSKYEMVNVTVYQELNRTMEIPLRHITHHFAYTLPILARLNLKMKNTQKFHLEV